MMQHCALTLTRIQVNKSKTEANTKYKKKFKFIDLR